jgi:hypothetical protein
MRLLELPKNSSVAALKSLERFLSRQWFKAEIMHSPFTDEYEVRLTRLGIPRRVPGGEEGTAISVRVSDPDFHEAIRKAIEKFPEEARP